MTTQNNPQELWVPPSSRANIEQTYFNDHFGDFFRINAMWITPLKPEDANKNLFVHPYIDYVYTLQVSFLD
jgi:hypothetical protein